MATQDDIVRLLDELVRLQVHSLRKGSKQVDTIRELNNAGLGPSRIADLLGTSANTVNVALAREKKRKTNRTKGTEE